MARPSHAGSSAADTRCNWRVRSRGAKAAIVERAPDVMFIDVWLGTESRFELMGWIEEMHPALASRVTFATGELADSTDVSRIWKTLGRPVLQKPFDLTDLQRSIEDAERREGT